MKLNNWIHITTVDETIYSIRKDTITSFDISRDAIRIEGSNAHWKFYLDNLDATNPRYELLDKASFDRLARHLGEVTITNRNLNG